MLQWYNSCVCLYLEVPILLGSIHLLEIQSMKDASVQQQSSYLNRYHLKVTLRLVLLSESTSVLQTLSSIAFGTHANLFPIVRQWMLLLSALSNAWCGLSKYSYSQSDSPCSSDIIWFCTSITPAHASLCTLDMVTSVTGDCGPSSFLLLCWNRKALCQPSLQPCTRNLSLLFKKNCAWFLSDKMDSGQWVCGRIPDCKLKEANLLAWL
jgi:hypothetical protein